MTCVGTSFRCPPSGRTLTSRTSAVSFQARLAFQRCSAALKRTVKAARFLPRDTNAIAHAGAHTHEHTHADPGANTDTKPDTGAPAHLRGYPNAFA